MQTRRVFQQAEFAHDRLADFIADTRAQASPCPKAPNEPSCCSGYWRPRLP